MKGTDRAVMVAFLAVGLLVAFYLMILSPKREEASLLGDEVTQLEAQIAEQEQVATYAQQAREDFPTYYGRMVVLGKAVPEGADTASLMVTLNAISNDVGTEFNGLQLAAGTDSAAAAAPTAPATPTPPADGSAPPADGSAPPADGSAPPAEGVAPAVGTTPTGTTPAPATESAAASLPIGATVGAAGLPTLPYDLDFMGNFFQIADYVSELDKDITLREDSGNVKVDGRLMTVDGFALTGGRPGPDPVLDASFLVTTYVTPAEQGLTLGASPTGPAPVPGQAPLTQTSSVSP
jgi:Tfp pilus assembly protein PilO